ncbi:MAG TPA: glycosyl hydrolase family 18 protein [Ignavibacteriales bacterium]|nr:glycosyl hydrolase family 18 protein [Ignavibacteriales bacterium]
MKKFLTLSVLILLMVQNLFSQNLNGKRVIGYYNWDNSSYPSTAIDFTSLTHICHAFLWPLADGSLDQSQLALYPDMITAAHNNGVKVLVSIGGYGNSAQNTGFKTMVNSTTARAAFITNLVNFIKANKYDGADFDWEYPASGDKENFVTLLTDLRAAFNANNIPLMTAAVYNSPSAGYDVPKLNTLLDWIGIMTYDFTGSWEQAGTRLINNSALYSTSQQTYSIDRSVNAWIAGGMSKSKVCAGMPFYGYLMNAPDMYGSITSTSGAKALSYNTIASSYLNNTGWQYTFDNNTKTPYLRNTAHTQVISFDDTTSTRMKCDYINAKGLAGAIIWKIAQSYNATSKANPLLKTVGDFLLRSNVVSVVPSHDNGVPGDYVLSQNYPNPFNPSTTINFSLIKEGNVRLTVFDALGKRVAVVVNEFKPAGNYSVRFDGTSLPGGMYIYRLEAGEFTSAKKFILMK